jgi:serine protease Do
MVGRIVRTVCFFLVVTFCGAAAGVLARFALLSEPFFPVRAESGEETAFTSDEDGSASDLATAAHLGVNHDQVKKSFRDVVDKANRSTVRVRVDDHQVALGTIVGKNGWILTKASELSAEIICVLPGGKSYPAEIMAEDSESDLALLRIPCQDLQAAEFKSVQLPRGSWLAVPSGVGDYPLVIGVVATTPREIEAERAMLGIELEDSEDGPFVNRVLEKSTAAKIGLKNGDVVKNVNGKDMLSREELVGFIRSLKEGDKIRLQIVRDGGSKTIKARLGGASDLMQAIEGLDGFERGPTSQRRSGFARVIQHDCVLLPRQCGGPLVDVDGQIIGVNIARAGRIATYALPSEVVRERLAVLKEAARLKIAQETVPAGTTPASADNPRFGGGGGE